MRLKDYTDLKMGYQLSRNVFGAKLHCHQYIVCFLKYRDSPHCNMAFVKETPQTLLFVFIIAKRLSGKNEIEISSFYWVMSNSNLSILLFLND